MRQTVGIHAAEHGCVAGHDKVVLRDIVLDKGRAIEHGKAIAQIAQGVVHAGQSVGGVRVKGLISTGGLVVDFHIADTRDGGAAGPDILVVGLNSVGDHGVDRVPGTCHMQEAAVLLALSTGKAGTKLQSVLDLLAGHGHQTGHVAKGADGLAGLEAPGASLHIGADAAAIHNGDITVELLDLVEVGVDAVGHEVAEVGLAGADAALAGGGIVDVEFGIAHCDLLAQHIVHCADPVGGGGGHGSVQTLVGVDELSGDGAVRAHSHLADVLEVRTGLGQGDCLAGSIGDLLVGHHGVGVAVDEGGEAVGVCNDFLTGPGRGGGVNAQMAQTDDGVSAPELSLVDGFLNGIVELLAVLAAQNVVDVLGLGIVHKVGRGGLGEGLGGGHAHKGDLAAAHKEELDAGQDVEAGTQIDPVAGDIGEVGFPEHSLGAGHAVVELVVAGGGQIVTGLVHQLDDGSAVIHGAVSGALDMVTCIHQQHIPAGVLDALFQGSNGGIGGLGGLVVDIGVDIVGVEDGHIRFVTKEAIGLLRKGGGCTDRNCGQCRGSTGSLDKAAAGNELFHRERPPLIQYALSALSFHAVQRCFPFWETGGLQQDREGCLLPKS